jgi:para-aminobenzoate synthetase component 1
MNQQRSTARRHVADPTLVKRQILFHTSKFEYGICLDNNSYKDVFAGGSCELLAGFGHTEVIEALPGQAFDILKKHRDQHADWLFGGLSYDLKAETENLPSSLPDGIELPCSVLLQARNGRSSPGWPVGGSLSDCRPRISM